MTMLTIMLIITLACCFLIGFVSFGLALRHYISRPNKYRNLTNRDAVMITGCDSGIGLYLAKYFIRTCNFKVICCFLSPNKSDGYKELDEMRNHCTTDRVILQKLDITNEQDVETMVEIIGGLLDNKTIDNLAALINNAGVLTFGEFDWLTWKQIQLQVDVNLTGTLRITHALLPYIYASKGRVINVTSAAETTVFPGVSVYSATKRALVTWSKGLGYELQKFGSHAVTMRLGDFANLTNIMVKHSADKSAMWEAFGSQKKEMYDEYFHQFHDHVVENRGMIGPKSVEDSSLLGDFRDAVLLENPPSTIVSAPISFRIVLIVLEFSPVWVQYYVLDLVLQSYFGLRNPQVIKKTQACD